jgi:hypothetical protein
MSKKYKSIKDIAKVFWKLEEDYDLYNFQIEGIYVWQIFRGRLFYDIVSKLLYLGEPHRNTNKLHKLKQIPSMLYNAIYSTAFFYKKVDTIIFPHDRIRLIDGKYIDIYTKYFIDNCKLKDDKFLVLEKPYLQKHWSEKDVYKRYLDDSILYTSLLSKIIFVKYTQEQAELLKNLEDKIIDLFNIKLDLFKYCEVDIKKFKLYYKYYYKLFLKLQPKQIYVLVSYAYPWKVQAARDLGIEVIELQHGAYSKFHLGYSHSNLKNVAYFPDKLYVWNQYWKDVISYPIDYDKIIIYPFKHQTNEMEKYKTIQKKRNQVVVLSQGSISNSMSKIILDNFDFFQNKIIKYKLHPGEIDRYKQYPYLMELLKKDNVELVLDGNLYELFASSTYQVGVYSTAIYEGLEFGLKTILCNAPFVEYMDGLVSLNKIDMVLYEK